MGNKAVLAGLLLAGLLGCTSWNSQTTAPNNRLLNAGGATVGQPAPDIVGKDVDGVEFALSDYKGKVVMLDFWGNW